MVGHSAFLFISLPDFIAPNDQVILEAMRFANEVSYVPPLAPAAGMLYSSAVSVSVYAIIFQEILQYHLVCLHMLLCLLGESTTS